MIFELVNRAYFAAFVSDRGDEFFEQFRSRVTRRSCHLPSAALPAHDHVNG